MLSVIVWVGGMFFAWMVLRPAVAEKLVGADRLKLWEQVFEIFFIWVWIAIILLLGTGYHIIFAVFGGMKAIGLYIHIMQGLGLVMMLIFAYLYFKPYKYFKYCIEHKNFQGAAVQLVVIRKLVGTNLLIGLVTVVVATMGRYYLH